MNSIYIVLVKPILDRFFSFFLILLFFPLFIILVFIIKLSSKGPVFFIQERLGKDFTKFNLIKFRTMHVNNNSINITSNNDTRITKLGFFLRKYKLDELAQLFNILKGDMSFVGPRPEVIDYARYFLKDYKEILKIKPGLTDYAAIKYRDEGKILDTYENKLEAYINEIMPKKIACYKKYINDISFFKDFKIILKTFLVIIEG